MIEKGNFKGIEPDSKSQKTMQYENNLPVKVTGSNFNTTL